MKRIIIGILTLLVLIPLSCEKIPLLPEAEFIADYTSIVEGDTVHFYDLSTNQPFEWSWNFGDGNTSSEQHPVHIYDSEGVFDVTLRITNEDGRDSTVKSSYIIVDLASLIDYDGNVYKVIRIGEQVWMAENLRVTHYSDGMEIIYTENPAEWHSSKRRQKSFCFYDNNPHNWNVYGCLYNWTAVMNDQESSNKNPSMVQGVCPDGWHVPSDNEWKELELYLGIDSTDLNLTYDNILSRGTNQGSMLAGQLELWEPDAMTNDPGFGSTEFAALPGGMNYEGGFSGLGLWASFYTSTLDPEDDKNFKVMDRGVLHYYPNLSRFSHYLSAGKSVRCVRDEK